jgi:hypothetical protein
LEPTENSSGDGISPRKQTTRSRARSRDGATANASPPELKIQGETIVLAGINGLGSPCRDHLDVHN